MPGSYTNTKSVMETRRARAEIVQKANERTPLEQLAHLDKHNLVAAKERAKIAKKLQKLDAALKAGGQKRVKKTMGDPVNGRGATVWVNE